jgi:N-acetylmuramoyl-L-alanine amidase
MAIIAVNAGHYLGSENYDPGAVNEAIGLTEAEINVAVAHKVEKRLKDRGHQVVYIHKGELDEITDASNEANADVFVSIHCNSAGNPAAHGVETFCHATSYNGHRLATLVQDQLVACLGLTDRGVKTNVLYVTKSTDAVAILAEIGFISNPDEATLMATGQFQDKAAAAIAQGVLDYFG